MTPHGRKISVVGLGYVGLPVAVEFGKYQHVIGFDISTTRIEDLQKGIEKLTKLMLWIWLRQMFYIRTMLLI